MRLGVYGAGCARVPARRARQDGEGKAGDNGRGGYDSLRVHARAIAETGAILVGIFILRRRFRRCTARIRVRPDGFPPFRGVQRGMAPERLDGREADGKGE